MNRFIVLTREWYDNTRVTVPRPLSTELSQEEVQAKLQEYAEAASAAAQANHDVLEPQYPDIRLVDMTLEGLVVPIPAVSCVSFKYVPAPEVTYRRVAGVVFTINKVAQYIPDPPEVMTVDEWFERGF